MKQKTGLVYFHAYRYLLIPQEYIQTNFITDITDKTSLEKKKNLLFEELIRNLPKRYFSTIKFQVIEADQQIFVMKMGMQKHTLIGTPELIEEEMEDWHSVYVIFNFPMQMFLIQHKTKVSADTGSLVKKIIELLQTDIKKYSLNLQINPILKTNHFWDIVKKYNKRIRQVDFILTAPNFARITKFLGEELQAAMKSTSAAQAKIVLSSDEQSVLNISENDKNINSIVKYAQAGGGSFNIRLYGVKRKTSKDGAKELSVDSVALNAKGSCLPFIKELFKDADN